LARELQFTQRYLSNANRLARGGSRPSRDVVRVLRALQATDDLPMSALDASTFLPSISDEQVQQFAYRRRVPGRNLWVWYPVTEGEIRLLALTRTP
jgi:hypothetical protein